VRKSLFDIDIDISPKQIYIDIDSLMNNGCTENLCFMAKESNVMSTLKK
jgi:hypothetical protein